MPLKICSSRPIAWLGETATAQQNAPARAPVWWEQLRGVEGVSWEIGNATADPPRLTRLTRRLSRAATLPAIPSPLAVWCGPCNQQGGGAPNDDDNDADISDIITRHARPSAPRVPQRGEWLLACWFRLHGFKARGQRWRKKVRCRGVKEEIQWRLSTFAGAAAPGLSISNGSEVGTIGP